MASINKEIRFYYRLCDGESVDDTVDRVKMPVYDGTDVGELREVIYDRRKLDDLPHCSAAKLRIYEPGTSLEDLESDASALKLALPLSADVFESQNEDHPLLVVYPPKPPTGDGLAQQDTPILRRLEEQQTATMGTVNQILERLVSPQDKPVSFSSVTEERLDTLLKRLALKQVTAKWPNKPNNLAHPPPFAWKEGKEDSQANREAYLKYLEDHWTLPDDTVLRDAVKMPDLLNANIVDTFKTRGNIDVVLVASHELHYGDNILVGIELKKNTNSHDPQNQRQALLQHIAASCRNFDSGVLTLLTDLNERWKFFWFAEKRVIGIETTRSEAMYLLRYSQCEVSSDIQAPETFLNRASWEDMFSVPLESVAANSRDDDNRRTDEDQGEQSDGNNRGGYHDQAFGGATKSKRLKGNGGGSRPSGGTGRQHAFGSNLDYMDEEEKREAEFRLILRTAFRNLLFAPGMNDQKSNVTGPPSEIYLG